MHACHLSVVLLPVVIAVGCSLNPAQAVEGACSIAQQANLLSQHSEGQLCGLTHSLVCALFCIIYTLFLTCGTELKGQCCVMYKRSMTTASAALDVDQCLDSIMLLPCHTS